MRKSSITCLLRGVLRAVRAADALGPWNAMAKLIRALSTLATAGIVAAGAGFLVFADTVRTSAPGHDPHADAIVVLTGDEERITTGVRLLAEGPAALETVSAAD